VSSEPRIRAYAQSDCDAVVVLVRAVLSEFGFHNKLDGVEVDIRSAHERYAGGGAGFWVAEDDGGIVGTVAVRRKEGRTCEIKRLYLRPDRRGAGLGQALYEHAERFARAAGYERIWLDSSRRFEKARRLYERNGFVLLAERDGDWCDNEYEKLLT
jgi:GNAT superfamily N-acetyltransferase